MKKRQLERGKLKPILLGIVSFALLCMAFSCFAQNAAEYKSFGRRDPFVPLVGTSREGAAGDTWGILTIDDVVLQGIVVSPDGARSVVINGEIMKEGDKKERLFVESITENTVTIVIEEQKHELKLYE